MRKFALVLLILGSVAGGCSFLELVGPPPRECTDAGCVSAVTFHLRVDLEVNVAYEFEACIDERCERETLLVPLPDDGPFTGTSAGALTLAIATDSVTLSLGDREMLGAHRARITVLDGADVIAEADEQVEFDRQQPNGPGCEPICWFAEVRA